MQWITQQSWSTKRIYSYGGSAEAIAGYLQPIASPSNWIHAQCLNVGSSNVHNSMYQQGAYRFNLVDVWLDAIKESWYKPELKAHEAYSQYWNSTSLLESGGYKNINFPSIHFSGTFIPYMHSFIRLCLYVSFT